MGYCILHNGRMCSELEGRYLHIRSRCLQAADMLGALSYEAQAPLKMRPRSLGQDRACESISAHLQVSFHKVQCVDTICFPHLLITGPLLRRHCSCIMQCSLSCGRCPCHGLLCLEQKLGSHLYDRRRMQVFEVQ